MIIEEKRAQCCLRDSRSIMITADSFDSGQLHDRINDGRCVVVVGMKLELSGRELLGCALATLANPGDRVIGLHIARSPDQAADMCENGAHTNQFFETVKGAHESFCRLKHIDLELMVIIGSSFRDTLIEEVRKHGLAKLILGARGRQALFRSSFSLAKHCSKGLPQTCSVLVVDRGRVVFQKTGTLRTRRRLLFTRFEPLKTSITGVRKGVVNTMQKGVRCRSWKQQNDSGGDVTSQWWLDANENTGSLELRHGFCAHDWHYSICDWLGGSDKTETSNTLVDISRLQYDGSTTRSIRKIPVDGNLLPRRVQLLDCRSYSRLRHKCLLEDDTHSYSERQLGFKASTLEKHPRTRSSPKAKEPNLHTLAGWPLLHRSISRITANPHCSDWARRLSVVEWALQLPDRPKDDIPELSNGSGSYLLLSDSAFENVIHVEHSQAHDSNADYNADRSHSAAVLARKFCQGQSCREFKFEQLKAATDGFSLGNLIGKGGCSEVYRGTLPDGLSVAIKRLNSSSPDINAGFLTEIEISNSLQHDHIVPLIGYCVSTEHDFLVYPLAPEGNLQQKLQAVKGDDVLLWESRYRVAVAIAQALDYLHNKHPHPVIHRDVKSSNILLVADLQPQLTDFGLAKWVPAVSAQITCSDVIGTFGYLAPEYFMFGRVSEKTDVYSFGVVLLELISGRHPIDNGNPNRRENLIVWAKSLLRDEASFGKLLDPTLEGAYSTSQLRSMAMAASACLRQSALSRPRMCKVLELLKCGEEAHYNIFMRQMASFRETEGYGLPKFDENDIGKHLSLALLDLDDTNDDNEASVGSSDSIARSNINNLDEYLKGRHSRSSSFE